MIINIVKNRAIYDILYLILSYPEKQKKTSLFQSQEKQENQEKHLIDEGQEDEEGAMKTSEQMDRFYNVRYDSK